MLVQPLKILAPLALPEPDLPGAIPQASGQWGINLAAALLNFPNQGLKVFIPVWSNKSLADKVELLLNNNVVAQHTVTQDAELTQRTTLFVAPGRLQTGSRELAYQVTRFGQQKELFAPPLELFVKLELPAGQDTDPDYGHSNLYMAFNPAEIVQDGVDKDTAKDGVDILVVAKPGSGSSLPYPDIAVGDVITVSWGGQLVQSDPVTQEQIDDPVNHPIVIHIDEATLLAAGDSGPEGVAVTFMVQDIVLNQSEDWCKETRIVVDTGNSRLDAPILAQANGNELDVDNLGNEQLRLQVWAASAEFKQADVVIMHLTGTTAEGKAIEVEVRQSIDKTPPTVVEVLMDNDGTRALAKTQARFAFELERGGSVIQRSKGRFINIVGESERLKAPIVESEVGGALDPNLERVIMRIPYDPQITPENAIVIIWVVTLPDGTVYEPDLDWIFPTPEEADDAEGFIVFVSGIHLESGEGGTLDVSYNLLSEGENGEIISRPSLPAAQLNIGKPKLELVQPMVLGEKDGALEPKDLPNGISEVTCPNPVNNPTEAKDVVYWQMRDAQDKLLFEDNKLINSLSAGKDVKFLLGAALVQQHFEARRGEKLSVRYHIVRFASGKTSYSNPLEFVVGVALDLTAPRIEEAPNDTSLVPNAAKDTLTAVVDYPNMALNDEIIVTATGASGTPAGGSYTAPPTIVTTLGAQNIPLANSVVAFNLNKDMTFSYTVKRGNNAPLPSKIRTLAVQSLTLDLSNVPKILQAANNGDGLELDLNAISASATIHAPRWPLIALKQYVWLRIRGTLANGTAYEKLLWTAPTSITNPAWLTSFYEYNIPIAVLNELKGLKDASSFTIEFKAALAGSQNEAEAVTFPLRTYTIKAVEDVIPAITKAEDSKDKEILQAGITVDTTVKLTGTASKGQKVDVLDGTVSKGQPVADATTGIWTLTMTGLSAMEYSFIAKALYGSGGLSAAKTLTVTDPVAPIINLVKGLTNDRPIANGDATADTTLMLSGTAAKGQQVEILVGQTSHGQIAVDADGTWKARLNNLSYATHSITVKAGYGSLESALHTVVITQVNIDYLQQKGIEYTKGQSIPYYPNLPMLIQLWVRGQPGTKYDVFINGILDPKPYPYETIFETGEGLGPLFYRPIKLPGAYVVSVGPKDNPSIRCPPWTVVITG